MQQTQDTSPDRADEFRALLLPVLDAAYGWALHATRNRADAEDLVQDAVSNALGAFAGFRTGTNFKAWFFRILMNCFYSSYRKQKSAKTTVSIDDAPALYLFEKSGAAQQPAGADPARTAMARITQEHISAALEELPDEFRDVATLYFGEDFTYQELAQMLNIPIGTVRSRLHRARRMLQKRLWQLAYE